MVSISGDLSLALGPNSMSSWAENLDHPVLLKGLEESVFSPLMMFLCPTLHDGNNFAVLKFLLKLLIRLFFTALYSYFC